jgi:hypothetical protein
MRNLLIVFVLTISGLTVNGAVNAAASYSPSLLPDPPSCSPNCPFVR